MTPARASLVAAFLAATTPIHGQQARAQAAVPTVGGVVRDASGTPLSGVEVGVFRENHLQQFVLTDATGTFLLSGMGEGVIPIRFRRLGYTMQLRNIDSRIPTSSALEIVLTTVASELEEVTVSATEGRLGEFYQRREQRGGFARFYEEKEIRRAGITRSSELFRTVPGVILRTSAGGNSLRIRGCQPMVWIDGQRVPGAELDEVIQPVDIAAIEFYASNAGVPAQYTERENRLCGTIIVWSRTQ
jgi:hypothetical protein